jgi:hypothetical protein
LSTSAPLAYKNNLLDLTKEYEMNPHAKTNQTATEKATEAFSFQSMLSYADKDEYAAKALLFDIESIAFEPNAGFDGRDRWSIRVATHDGRGAELITLQSNEKRDEQMRRAATHIDSNGAIKNIRLKRSGKTYYFEDTSAR